MKIKHEQIKRLVAKRRINELLFISVSFSAIAIAVILLFVLIFDVVADGFPRFGVQFLSNFPSRLAEKAGFLSAWVGSVYLIIIVAAVALPVGVGAAVYLEEYAAKNKFTHLIEINIGTLAGIPSIIYGLLGLGLFVRTLKFERSLLAGGLTLVLLILPIIIIASREAIRTVPLSIREGSYALGATKWQTISRQVLPLSIPGILTGSILALSRAIGEAAPLITIGALTYVAFLPDSLYSPFTAMPIQIFNWVSRPQKGFIADAAAGIMMLLVILAIMNSLAIFIRNKYQKRLF